MKFMQAVKDFLNKNPTHQRSFGRRNISESALSPLSLPDEYNSAKFDGSRVVNGKFCNTVGEYKDAWNKSYGDKL